MWLLLVLSPLFCVWMLFLAWACDPQPRGFRPHHKVVLTDPEVRWVRERFLYRKLPATIDVIVIGSGISSLACASALAQTGKRVVVLEQHFIAGGSTHAFQDKGFEFDTGVHYVGNVAKLSQTLDVLTDKPLEWDKLGGETGTGVYDEIHVGNRRYRLCAGEAAFIAEMVHHFPLERGAVEAYLKQVKITAKNKRYFELKALPRWIRWLLRELGRCNFEDLNTTTLDMMHEFTQNEELIAALCGQFGDCGPTPSKSSWYMHAAVVNHYLDGGYYVRGGCGEIAKRLVGKIKAHGGIVLTGKAVTQIRRCGSGVMGVEMETGEFIPCSTIVSGVGAVNTYHHLLPHAPHDLLHRMRGVGNSCTYIYLFVGLAGDSRELGLPSYNIWNWPDKDYDAMLEKFMANPLQHGTDIPYFMSFPSAKDSTWSQRHPGKSTAIVLIMADQSWFEEWNDTKQGHRGEEYEAKKTQFKDRILNDALLKRFPHLEGKVQYVEVGSPLSVKHYLGSSTGECYGLECTPGDRFHKDDWLLPQTPIHGLFLTGQDVTTLGFSSALSAGVLTASVVQGYPCFTDMLTGRSLMGDLRAMQQCHNAEARPHANKVC